MLSGICFVKYIIAKSNAVIVVLSDGTEATFSSDNLDLTLADLSTDRARIEAVRRFVEVTFEATRGKAEGVHGLDLSRVLPIINLAGLYNEILESNPDAGRLIQERLLHALTVYFVVSAAESYSYLTTIDLERSSLSFETVSKAAKDNMEKLAKSARIVVLSEQPWVAIVQLDGIYEGGLLALPDFWNDLEEAYGSLGVIYPSRGALLVFDASDPKAKTKVLDFIESYLASDPYPISRVMLKWEKNSWESLGQ